MTSEIKAAPEDIDRAIIKAKCEKDHLFFTRYFFKKRQGIKFLVNWHHHLIARAIQRVFDGQCPNLVINCPPGSSKTEMVVINTIARGLLLNHNARFLHISSSEDLVLLNSQTARDLLQSDEYQEICPLEVASDAKSKKRWNVVQNERLAGGVYAVALGGQITGFRAGHMTEGFTGAILIDDPLKADSAYSEADVRTANRQLLSTVKSRKANPNVPIIVIMQRLGEKDCTGFIKGGNLPGSWEFLQIPALIDDAYVATLPPDIQAMVVRGEKDEKGRFSYWEYKEPLHELLELEAGRGTDPDGNRISRHVFAAQYQQSPRALGGNIIHGEWFQRSPTPKILFRVLTADTAMKTGERNDYSVFQCWGLGDDKKAHLLDQIRGKWEAPELKRRAIDFWAKHLSDTSNGPLRKFYIEDKASGTGLIQDLRISSGIPVEGIEADKDKLTRVMNVLSYIEAGFVVLPVEAPWVADFIAECEAFTADDTHAHDDQIDPMVYAITKLLVAKPRGFFS